jgi:hypothetical protein
MEISKSKTKEVSFLNSQHLDREVWRSTKFEKGGDLDLIRKGN